MWILCDTNCDVIGRFDCLNSARAAQAYLNRETEVVTYLLLNEGQCLFTEHEQLKMEDLSNG
jgi:hypothetical protein